MLKILFSFFLICLSGFAFAQTNLPLDDFAKLPILHEGRVKPLDSFARLSLLQFSKKDQRPDMPAVEWLAHTLFDPATAVDQNIFLIENAETRHNLGLEERKKPLYSYAELMSGLQKTTPIVTDLMKKNSKSYSKQERNLLSVHENALQYTQILRGFSAILPLNIELTDAWRKKSGLQKDDHINFLSLVKIQTEIEASIQNIIKRKGENLRAYTEAEQKTVALGWQLRTLAEAGNRNNVLRVIPLAGGADWASPWEIINDGKGHSSSLPFMRSWKDIALAWQKNDLKKWESLISGLEESYSYELRDDDRNFSRLLEILYNQIYPFTLSIFFFVGAMLCGFFHLINKTPSSYRLSLLFLSIALISQFCGLLTRIYLMERPPVGTLYESILFVALIAPLVSLMVERKFKNGMGILCGGIAGTMLGIFAISMICEGDNMKVLGAVLNTRFWLATHVLCITIGYGWCLLTSVLAHLILVGRVTGKMPTDTDGQLMSTMTTHSLLALLFTTIGTILGGIWADQSWGRFWGWDPKENGALLITLWLIWLIHGKIAGQISQTIWLAGMAFLSVVVTAAWIGVNLLGVGLHSYGFIEGVFWGIALFSAFEIVMIGGIMLMLYRKEAVANAH